jgi:hypothetical protein
VIGLLLFVVLGCTVLVGCGETASPPPLTPDQERELEEQLEQASQDEGESQTYGD